jgi:hypothetical protein
MTYKFRCPVFETSEINDPRITTHKNSDVFWSERTYDKNGNQLTYKNSAGVWSECTYDKNGKRLIN